MRIGNITYTLKPDEKAVYRDGKWIVIKKELPIYARRLSKWEKRRIRQAKRWLKKHPPKESKETEDKQECGIEVVYGD